MVSLLEVQQLSYRRAGRKVLDEISLQLQPGDLVGMLGPNGAGKSTLLRLMMGLLRAESGRIRLRGQDLEQWRRSDLARELGYLPQAHAAIFPFSVTDIVAMGRQARNSLWRSPTAADQAAVAEALQRLGIMHLADRPYTELSGGERQSVLIARALAQGCRILLLDEPTAGLDYGQQLRLHAMLRELSRQGYAILASSHDPHQAREVFDQVVLMRDGRRIGAGPASRLLDSEGIRRLYALPATL